jgi:hypothetical protein
MTKLFNDYTIDGEIATIYIIRRNGDVLQTIVDTEDLEKLKSFGKKWRVKYVKSIKGYYVCLTMNITRNDGKTVRRTIDIQTVLKDTICKNVMVDHINNKTLDNRKENLRVCENKDNSKNRSKKNVNNTSGHRNVCRVGNRWYVQMQVDGKNTVLKTFPLDQLNEAGEYAEEMRKKYYGIWAGGN